MEGMRMVTTSGTRSRSGRESDSSRHCVLKLVPGDRQADLSSNPDSVTYCLCDLRQVT